MTPNNFENTKNHSQPKAQKAVINSFKKQSDVTASSRVPEHLCLWFLFFCCLAISCFAMIILLCCCVLLFRCFKFALPVYCHVIVMLFIHFGSIIILLCYFTVILLSYSIPLCHYTSCCYTSILLLMLLIMK